ncbi:MAG: hypothetical protein K8I60_04200 [Anaerolineae bacterium]|nr:hypothetical protein [Anaerolineae bacterium]
MSPIVEVVLFRLKAGVTEADFLREAAVVQVWVEQQPGYISRETLKTSDDQWLDVVRWTTLELAEKAGAEHMVAVECFPFMGMIDETSIQMGHYTTAALPVA